MTNNPQFPALASPANMTRAEEYEALLDQIKVKSETFGTRLQNTDIMKMLEMPLTSFYRQKKNPTRESIWALRYFLQNME